MATKTEIVIRIMKDNQGKAMADVLPLLMAEFGWTEKNARAAYALRVKADPSLGTVDKAVRAAPAKAAKAAKGPKLVKVPKPKVQGDKPKVTDKTVEELQDIRNKNLARLKAVGRKYMKGQIAEPEAAGVPNFDADEARQYVEDVTNDLDSFKSPRFLTMDAVKALV
jgi:hypothetical protein